MNCYTEFGEFPARDCSQQKHVVGILEMYSCVDRNSVYIYIPTLHSTYSTLRAMGKLAEMQATHLS